jgi:hypothetical protein
MSPTEPDRLLPARAMEFRGPRNSMSTVTLMIVGVPLILRNGLVKENPNAR